MQAEIIAVGDELTSGQRLDTNSQWLSGQLGDIGIRVLFHTTVGDDLDAQVRVLREAARRAELIVMTGGLGPTADDLTRQAIAEATGVELISDQHVLEHIRRLFAGRGRRMPKANEIQACFPAGSRVIPNPHGSAPGIDVDLSRPGGAAARLFALPGVPAEMREMWHATVRPAVLESIGGPARRIVHHAIKCFGVGESDLEQMLPDLIRRGQEPRVGITVSRATITLRISSEGTDEASCRAAMEPTIKIIHDCLGNLIFGTDDDELQHSVVRSLRQGGRTIASAECDSGGLLAGWLTEADPERAVYRGGIVSPAGIDAVEEDREGAESPETDPLRRDETTARELARQCRRQFAADYGLALGRLPAPAERSSTRQRVFMALATPDDEVLVRSRRAAGHPDIVEARAVKQCLDFLRLHLGAGS